MCHERVERRSRQLVGQHGPCAGPVRRGSSWDRGVLVGHACGLHPCPGQPDVGAIGTRWAIAWYCNNQSRTSRLGIVMSQLRDHGKTRAGRSSGLTERLARTSALHPWRTIGLWALLVVLAVLAIGSLLGSGLTSEMKFRAAKPDSLVGQELLQQRLTGPQKVTDFVIVRSATRTVDDAAFKAYVTDVAAKIQALGPNVVSAWRPTIRRAIPPPSRRTGTRP